MKVIMARIENKVKHSRCRECHEVVIRPHSLYCAKHKLMNGKKVWGRQGI